jgi:hypothetical protein
MEKQPALSICQLLLELLKDPERKSIGRIAYEVLSLTIKYRELPKHYFSRYLFKKDSPSPVNFLPNKYLYKLKIKFNHERDRDVLENKLFFDMFFQQYTIPLPRNVMFNNKNIFTINGTFKQIASFSDFLSLLSDAFQKTEGDSLIIKKTSWSYGGDHIYKVLHHDLNSDLDKLQQIYREVIKSGYLFQETVKQHPDLQLLNSTCLNTIRFDTFIDADGSVEIISAYLRTNIKGHHADNERSGGCEISIDLATGRLKKFGTLTLKYNGLQRLTVHPSSNLVFEDFQIPYFSAAKTLILQVARFIPAVRLVGWDVAISEFGPVVIEGNSDYDIAASDLAFGGYHINEVFCKVLKEAYKM